MLRNLFLFAVLGLSIFSLVSVLPNSAPSKIVIIKQTRMAPPKVINATVTAYTNCPSETNEDKLTATMKEPKAGWTVAVSHDLRGWLGGRIFILGIGVRKVEDLMNSRWTKKVDVLMPTKEKALEFGAQEKKVVYLGL